MEEFNMKEFQEQLKEKFEKEKKENAEKQALLTERARKKIGDIQFEPIPDLDAEALVKKRERILFEPPRDDDDRSLSRGDIKFVDPAEPMNELRLDELERGQSRILMMLQQLIDFNSKEIKS